MSHPNSIESRDTNPRTVMITNGVIAAIFLAIMALLYYVYAQLNHASEMHPAITPPRTFTLERAPYSGGQPPPSSEGYHWIDREHAIIQIPLERAIERIAEETEGK